MKKVILLLAAILALSLPGTALAEIEERTVVLKIGDTQALIDNQLLQPS